MERRRQIRGNPATSDSPVLADPCTFLPSWNKQNWGMWSFPTWRYFLRPDDVESWKRSWEPSPSYVTDFDKVERSAIDL